MTLPTWILSVNKWLQYRNSLCNPVIYGATKIFGERFKKFYSDCAVNRCGCQITARTHTDARYEALTYSENQALKLAISHLPSHIETGATMCE